MRNYVLFGTEWFLYNHSEKNIPGELVCMVGILYYMCIMPDLDSFPVWKIVEGHSNSTIYIRYGSLFNRFGETTSEFL